ncbi:MAG TPA: hypothetical protein VIX89_12165 [Bryobacteraceae bacterium]
MKKLWMVTSLASFFAAGAMAASLTGTISDAACGAKHAAASESDTACVQRCIKRGEAPVFISGGKVYKISADSKDKVMSNLGQKVTVTGKIDGDTVTVESVEPSK